MTTTTQHSAAAPWWAGAIAGFLAAASGVAVGTGVAALLQGVPSPIESINNDIEKGAFDRIRSLPVWRPSLLIFCFSLSWIWTLLGFKLRTPNAVMGVSRMVLFPLTFLSNVFVSPDTMPDGLRSVVDVNPVTILVDAARSLMIGEPGEGSIMTVLIMSAVLVAVFGPLTMRVFASKT